MSETSIAGSCLCGAVRYRVTGEIIGFQYCHCSRCRKFTGSAHAANLFTDRTNLEWLAGEESLGSYLLEAEPPFPTAFCKTCGSSMPYLSSTGTIWVVPAGSLDDDPQVAPVRSIFWDSRAPWYRAVGDIPCHGELPSE